MSNGRHRALLCANRSPRHGMMFKVSRSANYLNSLHAIARYIAQDNMTASFDAGRTH
jgi:hypothetical protein